MNEETIKLENVKKSCKVAMICARIIYIMMTVGAVLALVGGILMIANRDRIDAQLKEQEGNPSFSVDLSVGGWKLASIDEGDVPMIEGTGMTSSVPALQHFFEENGNSYSMMIGVYAICISVICLVLAVLVWLVSTVFDVILEEGNPFADRVPKRILIAMVSVTVVLGLSSGIGTAVVLGLLTWAVYTIVDYGRLLRTQSDETL